MVLLPLGGRGYRPLPPDAIGVIAVPAFEGETIS
jgi:hypothetical protein